MVLNSDDFVQAGNLENQGSELMAQILSSKMYTEYCKFKENMESCSHVNLNQKQVDDIRKLCNEELVKSKEQVFTELEKKFSKKHDELIAITHKEQKEILEKEYQQKIDDLNCIIENEKKK